MMSILKLENICFNRRVLKPSSFLGQKIDVPILQNINLEIKKCETFGLIGESGTGKTTLAMLIMGLIRPQSGRIIYQGDDLMRVNGDKKNGIHGRLQIIFQSPYTSLNPKMRIWRSVSEPLFTVDRNSSNNQRKDRAFSALEEVGLEPDHALKFPHELSGGQRQRVAIARALITRPELIIADEPLTALDLSVQAQILNLLKTLQEKHQLTYLFISHNLPVMRYFADTVAILDKGQIIQSGKTEQVLSNPTNSKVSELLTSILSPC